MVFMVLIAIEFLKESMSRGQVAILGYLIHGKVLIYTPPWSELAAASTTSVVTISACISTSAGVEGI